MSEKALKTIIYLAGGICLFVFVAVRSLPVLNAVLIEDMIPGHFEFTRYGELYYRSYISHFKEELPAPIRKYRLSEKHPAVDEADIFIFGDSFLDFSRQTTLPERLNDTLGKKVYYHRFPFPQFANPFCAFKQLGYEPGDRRTVIYETVERNIPMKFNDPFALEECGPNGNGPERSRFEKLALEVFPEDQEQMYWQFLKRSYVTSPVYAAGSTMMFNLFGYISDQTPVYKTGSQPWLFLDRQLGDEPGGFYYHYSQEEIDRYCDHIALLQKQMDEQFNLDMLFLPLPNKYTLYHGVVNDDPYNNFLPLLFKGLEERGVNYLDVYSDFKQSGEVLYYGTDSHWNKKGVDIALEKIVTKFQ